MTDPDAVPVDTPLNGAQFITKRRGEGEKENFGYCWSIRFFLSFATGHINPFIHHILWAVFLVVRGGGRTGGQGGVEHVKHATEITLLCSWVVCKTTKIPLDNGPWS